METITLTISEIKHLRRIQRKLMGMKVISITEANYLANFLSQLPTDDALLLKATGQPPEFEVRVWDIDSLNNSLNAWQQLFTNLPGFDFAPNCYILNHELPHLLRNNVIMVAVFAPSKCYNSVPSNDPYQIHFRDDGSAVFVLPSLEDAHRHPELFNFKGTWKEAYLLLTAILKQGWYIEEFPEELKQFLKK